MSNGTRTAERGPSPDPLLTQAQVAERWQCKERLVRELWQRRELPGVKIGRLVRQWV